MSRVHPVVRRNSEVKKFERTGAVEIHLSYGDKEHLAALLEDISEDNNYQDAARDWARGLLKELNATDG